MKRLLVPLAMCACGPPVSTLVAQHEWSASICAVGNAREAQLAVPAVVNATKARFRVHEITRNDLPKLDDAIAGDFFVKNAVLAIDTRIDPTATTKETILVTLENEYSSHDVYSVSRFTHESPPAGHEETQTTLTSTAFSTAVWAVFTLGASLIFDNRPTTQKSNVYVPPSHAELDKTAPRATAIATVLAAAYPKEPHYIVPRRKVAAEIKIEITGDGDGEKHCFAEAHYRAPLDLSKLGEWQFVSDATWTSLHTSDASGSDVDTKR